MQLGIYSFGDLPYDGSVGPHERLKDLVAEIELADQVFSLFNRRKMSEAPELSLFVSRKSSRENTQENVTRIVHTVA